MSHTKNYPHFARCVMVSPSKYSSMNASRTSSSPSKTLVPEYVYGYSAKGTKGNIVHMNVDGHLVYPSAACGIIWNYLDNTQVIFNQHNDDVVCVGLHPDKILAATGQIGKDDMVHIWDTRTGALVTTLDTQVHFTEGGVLALCFSNEGGKIAVVGGNPMDSTILIYDWQRGDLLGKSKCHNTTIYNLTFTPSDDKIVMCGKDVIKFFSLEGRNLVSRQGVFYPRGSAQTLYSCVFDRNSNTICGTKDGNIYIFSGNKLVQKLTAHTGPLYSIYSLPTGDGFVTAGQDGIMKVWLYTGSVSEGGISDFKLEMEMNLGSSIRSIVPDNQIDGVFFALKFNGDFLRIDTHKNEITILTKSHFGADAELWALCAIPGTNLWVSGADDSRMIIWNLDNRTWEKEIKVPKGKVRGVVSNGIDLVASTFEGFVYVYKLSSVANDSNPSPFREIRDGREEIQTVKFSPDGQFLACASHDNNIYLHETQKYTLVTKLMGHQSFVKQIDFSSDGKWMQSVCGAYELLYWDLTNMVQHKNSHDMADIEWASQTCTLGWTVKGIYLPDMDGTDINSIDVDFKSNLLVSADDRGLVRLLSYPATGEPSNYKSARGHCSHVTNVLFIKGGQKVISAGGYDLTVFQWRLQ